MNSTIPAKLTLFGSKANSRYHRIDPFIQKPGQISPGFGFYVNIRIDTEKFRLLNRKLHPIGSARSRIELKSVPAGKVP